jgi:hypothetical protein
MSEVMIEIEKEKQYLWPLKYGKGKYSLFSYKTIAKRAINLLIIYF